MTIVKEAFGVYSQLVEHYIQEHLKVKMTGEVQS